MREAPNPEIPTGYVEIYVTELRILSRAQTPPFHITDETDTNEELRQKLNELAKQYPTLREGEYREKLLSLFRERGLDLNAEQLDMLLLLRQKTDQMLLERKAERQESKP